MSDSKQCKKCCKILNINNFSKCSKSKDGLWFQCKLCSKERYKKWYNKNGSKKPSFYKGSQKEWKNLSKNKKLSIVHTGNLANAKRGMLEILEFSHRDKFHMSVWKAQCNCGKILYLSTSNFKRRKILNCGCVKRNSKFERAILAISKNYRRRKFDLSLNEFKNLIFSNCHYCGINPSNQFTFYNIKIKYNGIDRINSKKDYIPGNVVPCCKRCNIAKNDMTEKQFIDLIYKISANYLRKKTEFKLPSKYVK